MRAAMGVYMPCDERVGAESEALPAVTHFKPRRCSGKLSGRVGGALASIRSARARETTLGARHERKPAGSDQDDRRRRWTLQQQRRQKPPGTNLELAAA